MRSGINFLSQPPESQLAKKLQIALRDIPVSAQHVSCDECKRFGSQTIGAEKNLLRYSSKTRKNAAPTDEAPNMDQTNKYIIIKVAADAVPCLCVYLLNTRTHAGMLLTNWFPFSACERTRGERLSILTRFFNVFSYNLSARLSRLRAG
jgi:hypothetical protein